ncbi:MAG: ribose 5-phosphate isomerase B [Deltaproteobacteria bacterium]|nr:ribose 5-phosphate isomerase B [Deltaproteobacteria bacterium]
MSEKIAIGSDHRGVALKAILKADMEKAGFEVDDKGPEADTSVDYPVFAGSVARDVSSGASDRGVLICGSGIGMSIAANKFAGVRAALCHDVHTAKMCRVHNNANVLVMGERVGSALAREMLNLWLETPFEGGRHQNRLDLITAIEKENFR